MHAETSTFKENELELKHCSNASWVDCRRNGDDEITNNENEEEKNPEKKGKNWRVHILQK